MNEKWDGNLTLKFVEQYKKHHCLWNPDHSEYKNKAARDEALEEIVNYLNVRGSNLNVATARKKIRIIRSTYWNEKAKILRSNKVYTPKVVWFKVADKFLKNVISCRKSPPEIEPHSESRDVDFFSQLNVPDLDEQSQSISKSTPPTLTPMVVIPRKKQKSVPKDNHRQKKYRDSMDILDDTLMTINKIANTSNNNEFEIFGKSVAYQLRELPLVDAIAVQIEVQRLIGERRLAVIGRTMNQ